MTISNEELGKLLGNVQEKLASLNISDLLTPEQAKTIFKTMFEEMIADPKMADELNRKMRFAQSPAALQGTKFARHGLSANDVEWLYDLQLALRGARKSDGSEYTGPSEELENVFKAISDARYISADEIRKIDRQALDNVFPRVSKANVAALEAAYKAMDSAESGYGNQLVGAQYVGDLWEAARRESLIFGQLASFEMTAPTAYLPVEVDFPEMLYLGESTASNSSNYTTSKTGSNRVTVTASKFVIHQMWSDELEEDAIIPFIPFLRMQAAKGLAFYLDSCVLNGDTTNAATGNINLDDADPADSKHYLAFDGIRHAALVDNTANAVNAGGAVTWNALHSLRSKMVDAARYVDWGHPADPNDLIYVTDVDTSDKIAQLDEVKTVDKYGPNASILTGEVAKIGRNPLIVSMAMSKTEADGKVSTTSGNNTLGQVAAFNRKGFVTGWRRRVKIEVERIPATGQTRLVHSLRLGLGRFTATGNVNAIEAAAALYNISI